MRMIRLCAGPGSYESRKACWMTALGFIVGENNERRWSENVTGVCPAMKRICITINDACSPEQRERLIMPRLLEPLGTYGGLNVEEARHGIFNDVMRSRCSCQRCIGDSLTMLWDLYEKMLAAGPRAPMEPSAAERGLDRLARFMDEKPEPGRFSNPVLMAKPMAWSMYNPDDFKKQNGVSQSGGW